MVDHSTTEESLEDEPKSKSQIKREFQEFQALGKQLMDLPNKQLAVVPLTEDMREAILLGKSLKREPMNRQLRFIGKRMPNEDIESIRLTLDKLQQPHRDKVKVLHEMEQWRDQLLQGDQTLLEKLSNKFENFEHQHVRQLIRNAKKEQQLNKPPKSARSLFKYLMSLKEPNGPEQI